MSDEFQTQRFSRRKAIAGIAVSSAIGAAALVRGDGPAEPKSKPAEPDAQNPELQAQNPDSFFSPPTDAGDVKPFKYSFSLARNKISDAGWARQVTVRDLPISTTIAGVNMRLNRGAVRELHWHESAEWALSARRSPPPMSF
jgi:oxalate decarboxylase